MTETYKTFYSTLIANPSNDSFMLFADLLEEAGKETQAQLVRAALRLRDDLDPSERKFLGVPHPIAPAELAVLREEYERLEKQFISELGPDLARVVNVSKEDIGDEPDFGNDPSRIHFHCGVIYYLNLYNTSIDALPADLQIIESLDMTGTPLAEVPPGLQVGDLYLSRTRIKTLPDSLHVWGRDLHLYGTMLSEVEAKRLAELPGLSEPARIIGLRSAGYDALADVISRDGRTTLQLPPL